MEVPSAVKSAKINRLLPYWAVFQADLRQTLRSWIYRVWVFILILAAGGYLLYRVGINHEVGIVQPASLLSSDLLRWSMLVSIVLVIALTGGSISSERGTMADSVLSRGISRYQYFLGKWHARLVAVLATFLVTGILALAGSYCFLHGDLSLPGSLLALVALLAILALVATCGVTVSAISNSTVLGIAILSMAVYGAGFALTFLPARFPAPDRVLNNLTNILRGLYDLHSLGRLIGWSAAISLCTAMIGMGYFARRDV